MGNRDKQLANVGELRQRAETMLQGKPGPSPEKLDTLSPEAMRCLIHDLHVHQIELEMQNHELCRAQLELGELTARYLDLYDFAPVGYCTVNEQGLIQQANLTAASLLGIDRGALVEQPIQRFILDADQDIYYLHHKTLVTKEATQPCELRVVKADGTQTWVHLTSAFAQEAGGKPVHRIVLSDITERKQRDKQLHLQALVLDQIQEHVTITDLNGVVTYVNQSPIARHDLLGESMLGQHVTAYGDSPQADATQQEIADATLSKGVWNGKVGNVLTDGSSMLLELHSSLIKDDEGKPVAMVGVATDITQRSKMEEALRQHEQYQQALLDNFPFMVWLKDRNSRYLAVNQALATNHGWPSTQSLIGKNDLDISPPELAEKYRADDVEVLASGVSKQVEELIESGEQRLWFETYKSPVTVDGTVIGVVGFARDITSRKNREAELRAAMADADKANAAKSRFLAAASHDLRQPLSALSLYIGVLKARIAPDMVDLVGRIRNCVDSLSELLTDLLDVSKLDAGVVIPKPSDFAMDDMLAKLVSIHAAEAQLKGLRLRWRNSGAVAHTDQTLLYRLLGNLLTNAIRYTATGGILIACRRHHGKRWVEVWDTGIGIAEDQIGTIFEEFRQLGNDARNRGSGLGLAIVAKTAQLLGLQMRVRSRPGRGSLFAIELPQGRSVVLEGALPQVPTVRSLRIGLVEDNIDVLHALALALENEGHTVVATTTGQELLGRLGEQVPDFIISDYRLAADGTGFDVIQSARSFFGADLPAVIITGDTDPRLIRIMADRGIAVHYKPLQIETLRALLGEVTKRRAS